MQTANKKHWEKDFEVTIDSLFDSPAARTNFRLFLKESHNEEPFLFFESVEQYHHLRLMDNIRNRAKEIHATYIGSKAPKEINISQQIKNTLEEQLRNLDAQYIQLQQESEAIQGIAIDWIALRKTWIQLFDAAQLATYINMKEDNFPRYLRSKIFKTFISKDVSILQHVGIRRNSKALNSKDLLEFFAPNDLGSTNYQITERDFRFLESIKRDSLLSWKLIGKKQVQQSNVSGFASKCDVAFKDFADTQNHPSERLFKFTSIVDFPLEVVFLMFLDTNYYKKVDPNFSDATLLDMVHAKKMDHSSSFAHVIVNVLLKFSLGLLSFERQLLFAKTCKYDSTLGRASIIMKSIQHSNSPLQPKLKRMCLYGGCVLERVTEQQTRVTVGNYTDLKMHSMLNDTLSSLIFDYLASQRANLFIKNLITNCKLCVETVGLQNVENMFERLREAQQDANKEEALVKEFEQYAMALENEKYHSMISLLENSHLSLE